MAARRKIMRSPTEQTIDDLAMAQKIYDGTGRKWNIDRKSVEYRRFVRGCKAGIELEKKRAQNLVDEIKVFKTKTHIGSIPQINSLFKIYKAFDEYNGDK